MPFLESIVEVLRNDMSGNACERYRALPPVLEAEIKLVVLDPLDTADTFLSEVSLRPICTSGHEGARILASNTKT